jgi:hypothetical protein
MVAKFFECVNDLEFNPENQSNFKGLKATSLHERSPRSLYRLPKTSKFPDSLIIIIRAKKPIKTPTINNM